MKKEKKDQIIRRISEQSMLKLTPMPWSTSFPKNGLAKTSFPSSTNQVIFAICSVSNSVRFTAD
jgi:hypothetical protein